VDSPTGGTLEPPNRISNKPPRRRVYRRLLLGWLNQISAHPARWHLGVALSIVVASNLAFLATKTRPSLLVDVAVEALIVALALGLPVTLTVAALSREFSSVLDAISDAPRGGLPLMLRVVSEEMLDIQKNLQSLRHRGFQLETASASEWARRRFFATANGRYIGADSNPPSRYLATYHEYLTAHADYLRRTRRLDSVRILLIDAETLLSDRRASPDDFNRLLDWHERHSVQLRFISHERAWDYATGEGLGTTTDMAFWENDLALLWTDVGRDHLSLQMTMPGETDYERCTGYLNSILEHSEPIAALPELDNSGRVRQVELGPLVEQACRVTRRLAAALSIRPFGT
jgi:hypothetical protein